MSIANQYARNRYTLWPIRKILSYYVVNIRILENIKLCLIINVYYIEIVYYISLQSSFSLLQNELKSFINRACNLYQ